LLLGCSLALPGSGFGPKTSLGQLITLVVALESLLTNAIPFTGQKTGLAVLSIFKARHHALGVSGFFFAAAGFRSRAIVGSTAIAIFAAFGPGPFGFLVLVEPFKLVNQHFVLLEQTFLTFHPSFFDDPVFFDIIFQTFHFLDGFLLQAHMLFVQIFIVEILLQLIFQHGIFIHQVRNLIQKIVLFNFFQTFKIFSFLRFSVRWQILSVFFQTFACASSPIVPIWHIFLFLGYRP
jgi:hypothetical protein